MKLKELTEKHHDAIECMLCYFNLYSHYDVVSTNLTDLEIREHLIEVAIQYPSALITYVNMFEALKACNFGYDEKIRTNQEHDCHTFMFYSMMNKLIDLDATSNLDLDIWQWSNEHETFVNKNGISLN